MERARAVAVRVPVAAGQWLDGDLNVPERARGVVIFAHGSGSSRHSPRNQFVAGVLVARGMATLLMDLLTPEEDAVDRQTAHLRFDIALLADRLVATLDWRRGQAAIAALPVGLFGASTGAGAALLSAARRPRDVAAVVSRGGRPDLAGPALAQVTAPTLLIVGGEDTPVIEMNEDAARRMGRRPSLVIVPGASHLFEEPGTLERVAELAGDWFTRYLVPPDAPA
jgi:dienelactone hydrolase